MTTGEHGPHMDAQHGGRRAERPRHSVRTHTHAECELTTRRATQGVQSHVSHERARWGAGALTPEPSARGSA